MDKQEENIKDFHISILCPLMTFEFFNYNVCFKNKYVHNLVMRKFKFLMCKCYLRNIG